MYTICNVFPQSIFREKHLCIYNLLHCHISIATQVGVTETRNTAGWRITVFGEKKYQRCTASRPKRSFNHYTESFFVVVVGVVVCFILFFTWADRSNQNIKSINCALQHYFANTTTNMKYYPTSTFLGNSTNVQVF